MVGKRHMLQILLGEVFGGYWTMLGFHILLEIDDAVKDL